MKISALIICLIPAVCCMTDATRAATKPAVPLRVAYSPISGAGIVTWIAADKGFSPR